MIRLLIAAARIAVPIMFAAVAFQAVAEEIRLGDLTLSDAFTRAMPPAAKSGGGFVTITNHGAQDDRLVAASSPVAGIVELHEMKIENDIMVMREQAEGIPVQAGETVTLKPGGLHMMFMQVTEPFEEGKPVAVTLSFERAGEVSIMLPVAKIGATGRDGHDHMEMKHDHVEMKKD